MIRKHRPRDLETLMNIWQQATALAHSFLKEDFVEMVTDAMRTQYLPDSNTWVYEENDQIIGFISMLDNEIGGLFVAPNNHGKGIGTQLVDFIKRDFSSLEVEVFEKNAIGRTFYTKYGFTYLKSYLHEPSQEEVLRLYFE